MKNAKKILVLAALWAVAFGAMAQNPADDPKYGATPEERQKTILDINLLRDAYEMKNYAAALGYIYDLIEKAPKSTVNIYVRGANIYKTKIMQAKTPAERKALVDSLMYIYDQRLENFGDSPTQGRVYILTQKAGDYLNFQSVDRETIRKFFNDAIEAAEGQDPNLNNNFFKVLVDDYAADLIETDVLMDEFERLSDYFSASSDPKMAEGLKTLEAMLVASGAADCDKLEEVYKPQYEADPNNVELMQKIVNMMGRAQCSSDFMLLVTENLYKVAPEPQTGVFLATIFEQKEDFEKSLFYWQESINNEPDPKEKVGYIMRAATSALAASNYRQAASFAREALNIESENGTAYMILGQAYGAGAGSSCSDFERKAAFWLAVDNLQRARGLLSGDAAQTETLNTMINRFSANFPSSEDTFFLGLNKGDAYTVNCGWIAGRTTVR